MRSLHPLSEPYARHAIPRGEHHIYVEECGNPAGLPVLFLHGGPGSGCKPWHRGFFDPARYRIVLVDQRGAGRSTPPGEPRHNTTAHLLADLERIRRHLQIDRWLLFGGSWGATLGLLYGQRHPDETLGLILRGSFLARRRDLYWFIGADGVRRLWPDRWEHCVEGFTPAERLAPVRAFLERLSGQDELAQRRAARQWGFWSEQVLYGEEFRPECFADQVSAQQVCQARIETHYAAHDYFLPDDAILQQCGSIAHLPVILIHGRRDLVCPVEAAFELHARLPNSDLRIIADAGHLASAAAMVDALLSATEEMAGRLMR